MDFQEGYTMMHYERIRADLAQAKRTLKTALRSEMDSETERAALEEAFGLLQQAEKKCLTARQESMQKLFSPVMKM